MAATANAFVRGLSEVGIVVSSVDAPLGRTQQEGFTIQMNVTTVDLLSAQSKMVEDTGIPQVGMDLQINGIDGALQNIQRMFGMPATAFAGDLSISTDETLAFNQNEIGETEQHIYAEGPGPLGSVRRVDAYRTKVANVGPLMMGSTGWMVPTATWRVLNPGTDPVLLISDLAAS